MKFRTNFMKNASSQTASPSNGHEKYFYPHLPSFGTSKYAFLVIVGQVILLLISGVHDWAFLSNALSKIGIGFNNAAKGLPVFVTSGFVAGLLILILIFTMLHAGGLKAEKNQGSKRLWFGWTLALLSISLVRIFNLITENLCTTAPTEINPTPCANKPTTWATALTSSDGLSGCGEVLLLFTFSLLTALLAYSLGKIILNKNLNDYRYLDKKLNEDRDSINQDIKGLEAIGEKPQKIIDEYLYHRSETKDDMKKFRDDVLQILLDEYVKKNKLDGISDEKVQEIVQEAKEDDDFNSLPNVRLDSRNGGKKKKKKKNRKNANFAMHMNSGGQMPQPGRVFELPDNKEIVLRDKDTKEDEEVLADGSTQDISEIVATVKSHPKRRQ